MPRNESNPHATSRYLTVAEVAATLRCARGTLYNRLSRQALGVLRPRKVLGKWLIPADAVAQVLEHGERRALALVRGGRT